MPDATSGATNFIAGRRRAGARHLPHAPCYHGAATFKMG